MAVPIPATSYSPFTYISFSPIGGNRPTILNYTALMCGQQGPGASAAVDVKTLVQNSDHAGKLYGYGSQLHRTFISWFAVERLTKVYGVSRAASSFTECVVPYTFTASSLKAGTLALYIGGEPYLLNVSASDTPTIIAANLVVMVNKNPNTPVVATSSAGVLTLTFKSGYGILGNSVDVRFNLMETDAFPSGLTATAGSVTLGVGGSLDFSTDIGTDWYNIIVTPDATATTAWDTLLEDRWGPIKQMPGRLFFSVRGADYAALITAGSALNSKHLRYCHAHGVPSDPWQVAASVAANSCQRGQINPAAPLTNLELIGIMPPASVDRFLPEENEQLLRAGVTTFKVDPFGRVRIQRVVSTYKTNDQAAPDLAYLDDTTFATLSFIQYDLRNRIATKFANAVIVNDGVPTPSGSPYVSPSIIKAEMVGIFRSWQALGYVENVDQFINDLSVIRNVSDPTRVDIVMSPDLANPLMVLGINVRFIL